MRWSGWRRWRRGGESTEPESAISVPTFLPTLEGRAHDMGRLIGVPYGEGFTVERPPGVGDLMALG